MWTHGYEGCEIESGYKVRVGVCMLYMHTYRLSCFPTCKPWVLRHSETSHHDTYLQCIKPHSTPLPRLLPLLVALEIRQRKVCKIQLADRGLSIAGGV